MKAFEKQADKKFEKDTKKLEKLVKDHNTNLITQHLESMEHSDILLVMNRFAENAERDEVLFIKQHLVVGEYEAILETAKESLDIRLLEVLGENSSDSSTE